MTTATEETKGLLITRHLPVRLDQYRKNALADEMAKFRGEEIRITEHMKRVQTSLKAQIVEAQHKQTIAAEAINNNFEMKEIACRQVIDFDQNTVTIYREDTGDKVEERALEPKEKESLKKKSPMPPVTPSSKPSPTKEASHGL
jgi:fructose-1,6-bisphosphatase